MSKFDDLEKLKKLYDDGVLTREEYDSERRKILDRPDDVPQPEAAPGPQGTHSQIIINNYTANPNQYQTAAFGMTKPKNKWVALLLCFFLGFFGAHKFYEGKTGLGILYIFTAGLFFIGVIVDFFILLFKPHPYFV